MKQEINWHDILEKITPLIENTAMRFGYIPIEIEFVKENHRWFLRIYLYSKEKDVTLMIVKMLQEVFRIFWMSLFLLNIT